MSERQPEEIHRLFEEYFNAADLDSLVGLYEENAAFVPQPGQVLTGKESLRQALEGFLAVKGRIELTTQYVVRAGDIALLSCVWSLTGTGADGQAVQMGGKTAEVARRQADGSWLYVADHPFGAD